MPDYYIRYRFAVDDRLNLNRHSWDYVNKSWLESAAPTNASVEEIVARINPYFEMCTNDGDEGYDGLEWNLELQDGTVVYTNKLGSLKETRIPIKKSLLEI